MSFETWRAKYYPIPAEKVKKKDALQHSIVKWSGLHPSVLKRHGLRVLDDKIGDADGGLTIAGESCALCEHYYSHSTDCDQCPGTIANGVPCDDSYLAFLKLGDPKPMLKWLRKALK